MSEEIYNKMEVFAASMIKWASGSCTLLFVIGMLSTWIVSGSLFAFSNTWQASMTVPTAAITFLLVFLILRAQNKDTRAIQLKLNELIAAQDGANNELIDIENMSEQTLEALHSRYEHLPAALKELKEADLKINADKKGDD